MTDDKDTANQGIDNQNAENVLFEPIDADKVADLVVDQIERHIISGILSAEQKLPAERELAEQFNISRPKLREALQVLEQRGLVEVRKSGGTFISKLIMPSMAPAMAQLYSRHREAIYDFLEYRSEQESFAAHLAAQKATSYDKNIITDIIKKMEAAHELKNPSLEAELDIKLHHSIVEAAHNSVLVHMMRSTYGLINQGVFYNREFLYKKPGTRKKLLDQHRNIAYAIIDGTPEAAAAAAEAHMQFVMTSIHQEENEEKRLYVARKRSYILKNTPPKGRKRN
ncbi:MAG: FCD domain-containing protein [OCS116 cluster bacterium]|uniref:Pyruvate dehydrogenase complex repressor n=1 Tax=OCS116 cluster bacterium TaxID=2030921 RepID=A0A2A4Z3W0_9PROT|nr:FCD domain-containing protein [OCS116 cluster bacterium]